MNTSPGVGVAVLIWRDDERREFLLGRGHDPSNRETIYATPGGHWESGESLSDAARREVREEAGIEIKKLRFVSVFDFFRVDKQRNYVSIWFEAIWSDGKPRVMEPENNRTFAFG